MLFVRLVLGLRKLFIENQGNDPRNGARNENPIWTVLKWDIIHLGGHLVAVSGPLPQKQLGAVLFLYVYYNLSFFGSSMSLRVVILISFHCFGNCFHQTSVYSSFCLQVCCKCLENNWLDTRKVFIFAFVEGFTRLIIWIDSKAFCPF